MLVLEVELEYARVPADEAAVRTATRLLVVAGGSGGVASSGGSASFRAALAAAFAAIVRAAAHFRVGTCLVLAAPCDTHVPENGFVSFVSRLYGVCIRVKCGE